MRDGRQMSCYGVLWAVCVLFVFPKMPKTSVAPQARVSYIYDHTLGTPGLVYRQLLVGFNPPLRGRPCDWQAHLPTDLSAIVEVQLQR